MAWDSTRNDALMIRLYSFAQQCRALGWEAYQIAGLVEANGVLADPAFVPARGVSGPDAAALVAVADDLTAFLQGGAVAQANREADLHRILGGPLT